LRASWLAVRLESWRWISTSSAMSGTSSLSPLISPSASGRTTLLRFPNGEVHRAEQTCSGLTAMLTSKKRVEFAVCVANKGCDDLEVWKVYQVLSDAKAAGVGCIRVIDESGEDYLYPANRFAAVDFPKSVRSRLTEMAARQREQGVKRPPRAGGGIGFAVRSRMD
jgi:hypothetical protein